jgi:broad specificity phosphatase PhoE
MRINFIFVRHGYGCHNAVSSLYMNKLINKNDIINFEGAVSQNEEENEKLFIDPELTDIGINASAYNGCIVSSTIREIGYKIFEEDVFSSINIVGCSPLIRSMETAYEMTKTWSTPPDKIYVFPLLREIDERSSDKYSRLSRLVINKEPSYAMKPIVNQKKHLEKYNLDKLIDFKYVENNLQGRSEPGDIMEFIKWFITEIYNKIEPLEYLNVFIVTHAGVLSDFVKQISENEANRGFVNNSGFILSVTGEKDEFEIDKYISLNDHLPNTFFKDYKNKKYVNNNYYCPSNRCSNFCKYIKHDKDQKLEQIKLDSCKNKTGENLKITKLKDFI